MNRIDLIKLGVPLGLMVFVTVWLVTPAPGPAALAEADRPAALAGHSAQERTERSVLYNSCSHARAEGAAPLYEGDPGYREGLDRDGDGVACEPLR